MARAVAGLVLCTAVAAGLSMDDVPGGNATSWAQCLNSSATWMPNGTSGVLDFAGCFLGSSLNVTEQSPRSNIEAAIVYNASAPSGFTVSCGAFCAVVGSWGGEAQFVVNGHGVCECITPSNFMAPRIAPNASAACPAPRVDGDAYLRLYRLVPSCPLNTSVCAVDERCEMRDGCCTLKQAAKEEEPPQLYMVLVQWAVIIILAIGLLEMIVYMVIRCRGGMRRTTGWQDDAELRTTTEAEELSKRLLETFPPAPQQSMLTLSEETCVICLEELTTLPSQQLPCSHVLHRHCLREYLSHKLVNRNAVQCPMCRSSIAEL
jgi:hypothetical protein